MFPSSLFPCFILLYTFIMEVTWALYLYCGFTFFFVMIRGGPCVYHNYKHLGVISRNVMWGSTCHIPQHQQTSFHFCPILHVTSVLLCYHQWVSRKVGVLHNNKHLGVISRNVAWGSMCHIPQQQHHLTHVHKNLHLAT